MAPLKPVKKDAVDKRLQHVLQRAHEVATFLNDRSDIPASVEQELESVIKLSLPLQASVTLAGESSELDAVGCQLWNAGTNILRDEQNKRNAHAKSHPRMRLVVLLRVFGCLLVDAAHTTSSRRVKDPDQRIRTFKTALKTCRSCLDNNEVELAIKVLEKCSEYATVIEEDLPIVRISDASRQEDEIRLLMKRLVAEYYLLRMTHAYKTDRYDIAGLFFSKLDLQDLATSAPLAENAADMFHEAARTLSSRKMWDEVVVWCERAVNALDSCDFEDLSHDAPDLRLAVTATYTEALLARGTSEARARASNLVEQLEAEHGLGNRIAVSLMRFQISTAGQDVDLVLVERVMAQMTRLAVMTEKSFKTIMRTIHKLRRLNTPSALLALNDLVTARLLMNLTPNEDADDAGTNRLERAVVTYILFVTSAIDVPSEDAVVSIRRLLDAVSYQGNRTLSAKATHAAQTLIWKRAGGVGDAALDEWCKLLQHAVFESAGQTNKARIGRKAISAALARGDSTTAREAFYAMPSAAQNEGMTRYLMLKVALRDSDMSLANESLSVVAKHSDKDATYLYAFVLEAQQSNMHSIAVAALRALADQLPPGVHLPTLLRCTARLLIGELDAAAAASEPPDVNRLVEDVIQLFERAAKNTPALRQGTDAQWRSEVQWWSKNAYNLGLRICDRMHPEHLVRLLAVCTRFLDCYPADGGLMHEDNIRQRRLLCHFLSTTALMVLGRSSDEGSAYSKQSYSQARTEIAAFLRHCPEWESTHIEEPADTGLKYDMLARKFELLKFDMECILHLQTWQQLDAAVQAFLALKGADRWDSLADLVIVIHDHARARDVSSSATSRIPELLQKCINETWKRNKDVTKMSRWLRLTFTLNLEEGDPGFALKIVQQAAGVAKKGADGDTDIYPLDELQWLATMAFNKAVDILNMDEIAAAEPWIAAALGLAYYADDNGSLHANLTQKRDAATARMKAARTSAGAWAA